MKQISIRDMRDNEYDAVGRLMVEVYSQLENFPGPDQQPRYYEMLANVGGLAKKKDTRVLVAFTSTNELAGGVVYFGDMSEYGSGGTACQSGNASGIRLLAVDAEFRGLGVGRALANACIQLARERRHAEVILHSTRAMKVAWGMYERMGFRRSPDLDFQQEDLQVFGFRLLLK